MNNQQLAEPLEMSTRITAGIEVIYAELGAEISLLNIKSGIYYTLNSVGAHVWRQIHRTTTLSEIKSRLLEDYEVDEARCERDLLRIVDELRAHGLIDVSPP